MAKYKKGILGGFSGKVGNVIGSSWKGIEYMRSQPSSLQDAKTDAQLSQRMKFRLVLGLIQTIKPVIKAGFKTGTQRMSAYNSAMSYNLKNAVSGSYPDLQIDFAELLVARGDLIPVSGLTAESSEAGQVELTWTDNSGIGSAAADDTALIVAINPWDNTAVFVAYEGPQRQDGAYTLALPESFNGQAAEVYLAFVSADGSQASTSRYAGSVIIPDVPEL